MAKISARGCTKVASAKKDERPVNPVTGEQDYTRRVRLALRSDGKVLRAIDLLDDDKHAEYGSRAWNRGGYSIVGSLKPSAVRTSKERFVAYATERGFVID